MPEAVDTPFALRDALAASFTRAELDLLCADLGVRPEFIPGAQGATLDAHAQALLIYIDGLGRLDAMAERVAIVRQQIAWTPLFDAWRRGVACPYPGMVPFAPTDARFFFGRETEIDAMQLKLRHGHFLCVIGPSGSGKSSLVNAGLRDRLTPPDKANSTGWRWRIITFRPSASAVDALHQALGGPGEAADVDRLLAEQPGCDRLLVVIDQFEELFTLNASDLGRGARQAFVQAIKTLRAHPACAVLLAIRADFYPDLMNSDLWPVAETERMEIAPLRGGALRTAIVAPAAAVGVAIEPALVERLLVDAADEPGVLPLLQETMRLLWPRMRARTLTLEAYQQIGAGQAGAPSGLAVAIATKADATLAGLNEAQQAIARRIFLRLVEFVEGRTQVRRQQPLDALRALDDDASQFDLTLRHLTDNRLITLGGEGGLRNADIAHEALLRNWPQLRQWILQRREAELARRRLEAKADEWAMWRERNIVAGLLDETELLTAERWLASPDAAELGASTQLLGLTQASRAALDEERRQATAAEQLKLTQTQALADERARRLGIQRGLSLGLAALLLIAAGVAAYAWVLSRQTLSRQLAAQALTLSTSDTDTALLLSVAANQVAPGEPPLEARGGLISANQCCTDQMQGLLRGHTDRVWAVAYHPVQTRTLVSVSDDGSAIVWDLNARSIVTRLQDSAAGANMYSVAFSPDGALLATGSSNRSVVLRDTRDWRVLATLPAQHSGNVLALAFDASGTRLATGGADSQIVVWDVATRSPILTHTIAAGRWVWSVAFSPDGQMLASAGQDRLVWLWPLTPNATQPISLTFDNKIPVSVAFDARPDRTLLLAAGDSGRIAVWDFNAVRNGVPIDTNVPARTFTRFSTLLWGLAVHPAHTQLALVSGNGRLKFAQLDATESLSTSQLIDVSHGMLGHQVGAFRAAYRPDGEQLAVGGQDGLISIWSTRASPNIVRHARQVRALAATRDGVVLSASSSSDGVQTMRWERAGQSAPTARELAIDATLMSISPDGAWLAAAVAPAGAPAELRLLPADGGAARFTSTLPLTPTTMLFSPDGARLALGGSDGLLTVIDAATGRSIATINSGFERGVRALAFSPDGRLLATGGCGIRVNARTNSCARGEVRLWQSADLSPAQGPLPSLSGDISSLAFSATHLAAGTVDDRIVVWQVGDRRQVYVFNAHNDEVTALAFTPDGNTLASGDATYFVILWDMRTGLQIGRRFTEHDARINALAFDGSGEWLASASNDDTVIVRNLQTEALAARACRIAGRQLEPDEWLRYAPDATVQKVC